jgi:hypothetical protein
MYVFAIISLFSEETEDVVDDTEDEILLNNDDSCMDIDEVYIQPRLLSSGFYVFDCPHPQCIKQFRRFSNLETHLNIGKHSFTATVKPLLDQAKLFYKQLIESDTSRTSITLNQFNSMSSTSQPTMTNTLSQGWALAKKKPPTHYSADVINFLHDAFQEGIATGNKWDPVVLSQVSGHQMKEILIQISNIRDVRIPIEYPSGNVIQSWYWFWYCC